MDPCAHHASFKIQCSGVRVTSLALSDICVRACAKNPAGNIHPPGSRENILKDAKQTGRGWDICRQCMQCNHFGAHPRQVWAWLHKLFLNFFFKKKFNQNNFYIYIVCCTREKGLSMLYKERKTRVMCDFYMLYMKLRKHYNYIKYPPSSKDTHAYDSRAHMFYTPRHVCGVACT